MKCYRCGESLPDHQGVLWDEDKQRLTQELNAARRDVERLTAELDGRAATTAEGAALLAGTFYEPQMKAYERKLADAQAELATAKANLERRDSVTVHHKCLGCGCQLIVTGGPTDTVEECSRLREELETLSDVRADLAEADRQCNLLRSTLKTAQDDALQARADVTDLQVWLGAAKSGLSEARRVFDLFKQGQVTPADVDRWLERYGSFP